MKNLEELNLICEEITGKIVISGRWENDIYPLFKSSVQIIFDRCYEDLKGISYHACENILNAPIIKIEFSPLNYENEEDEYFRLYASVLDNEREQTVETTFEGCATCGGEFEIPTNKVSLCPGCSEILLPCSSCWEEKEGTHSCDWSEKNQCWKFPINTK